MQSFPRKNDFFLVGSQTLVSEKLERIIDMLRPDGLDFQANFGGMPAWMIEEQIELYAEILKSSQSLSSANSAMTSVVDLVE